MYTGKIGICPCVCKGLSILGTCVSVCMWVCISVRVCVHVCVCVCSDV